MRHRYAVLLGFRFVGAVFCCGLSLAVSARAGQAGGPALGVIAGDAGHVQRVARIPGLAEARPVLVLLTAARDEIESGDGGHDWTALERDVSALVDAGFEPALRLTAGRSQGARLPAPHSDDALAGWLSFVRGAVRQFAGRVEVFQIGEAVDPSRMALSPSDYAFVLKNAALAVRAEAVAAAVTVRVAQAAIPGGALDVQRRLWAEDVAAYIDILPVELTGSNDGLAELFEESVQHPPAATIWAYLREADRLGRAVEALASGATRALIDLEGTGSDARDVARWSVGVDRLLAPGFAPAPIGALVIADATGAELRQARVLGRFFSDEDFSTLILYDLPGVALPRPSDLLIVGSARVRDTRLVDPETGAVRRVGVSAGREPGGKAIRIARGSRPQAVLFKKLAAGLELPPEEIETARTRDLTAEEVIARHQAVQKRQDDRLQNWMAKGRIDFHFKLAQGGGSLDVSIDSNYFWERGGDLEWEQAKYYVNGNYVRWKKIPELPLIQAEKVVSLPLDLTLDRTYGYRKVGRERALGRDAYVLEFQPADPDSPRSLYRGRVWIDAETFVRLKAAIVQTGLDAPVLSNEEVDRFGAQPGPEGEPFWMLTSADGQQTWNVTGRTFVVRREVTFSEFAINVPQEAFEERRDAAYRSKNQMLRDTDQGFRYLERQDDGTRVVKETIDTSQFFAAAGAFRDASSDGVNPLAGVNYFNYNVGGKNIQMNAFFAGLLGFFTASKPDLFGLKIDLTVDAFLSGIKFEDKVFVGDVEQVEETIRIRGQNVALRLGLPAGQFFKFNLIAGLAYNQYFDEDDARRAIDEFDTNRKGTSLGFVLPQDHTELSGTFEAEFNRRGYTLLGSATWAKRSDWEAFGLFDSVSGSFGSLEPSPSGRSFVAGAAEAVRKQYARWGLTGFKEWYLPKFQKVRGEVNYLDGSSMDRFSRYEFTTFGDGRLNGFAGSGVRFDQGLIARAGYAFNLFEVIQFDAALHSARVRQEGSGTGTQSFSGLGLTGNFVGPWKTVISLSYGYAVDSDIPDLEGGQEFLVLIFKLF